MKRVVILISGRGSNMTALLDAVGDGLIVAKVVGVISNRPEAAGLGLAVQRGIHTHTIDHKSYAERDAFEHALSTTIDALQPDLVVLAGFMRILSAGFVARYTSRLINIHPSLLPAFPGLNTHRRALADGVKIHGCTAHFVTATVDHGPIIAQAAVAVHDGDTEEALAARVLAVEHGVLVGAVRWFCADRLVSVGTRVRVNGTHPGTATLTVPIAD